MKKLLLILMLAIVSSSAMAKWDYFGNNKDETDIIYIDPTTIRETGEKVKVWTLYDFLEGDSFDKFTFRSSKTHMEFDCKEEKRRILYMISYSENMGNGDIVSPLTVNEPSIWLSIVPGSIDDDIWKNVCGK